MSRTLFVMNPTAGGGRAVAVRNRILKQSPDLKDDDWIEGRNAAEAEQKLRARLADPDVRRVIAIGGDGTAHGVAQWLLDEGVADRIAFGLVPAGTGSDFARHLGLPKDPEQSLRQVLEAEPRPIDAIGIETDSGVRAYCLNIASAGLSGAVDLAVNAAPEHGSYLLATIKALITYRPMPCRVEVDDQLLTEEPFFVVAMANGSFFGKGMKVAPDARIDDGLLDVVLVPPVPLWQLPVRLPQFLTGRHAHLPQVRNLKAKKVRIEPPEDFFPFDLDGETLSSEPTTFRILPGALRLLA